ncbi:MAG: SMP-30/gluconolactonase/LRE family protein [Chloroflexota bacterium]
MTTTLPPVGAAIRPAVRVIDAALTRLIHPDAALERLADGCIWSEGPVWLPAEQALQWSDIPNDRALRWSDAAGAVEVRKPNDFTNGNTLDREGRVIHCEHGKRRVTRTEADGTRTVLVSHHEGRRLNSPNDVVVKRDGTIWFTDPPYGIIFAHEGEGVVPSEQAGCFVYRFDPASGEVKVVSDVATHPNGLAFSPDETVLYVADTHQAMHPDAPGRVFAMDVIDGRATRNPREILRLPLDHGVVDGLRVDVEGNLWASFRGGILVLTPEGRELGRIEVPEVVSNCVFGGPDGLRLFITASSSLYAIEVRVLGAGVGAAVGRGEAIA